MTEYIWVVPRPMRCSKKVKNKSDPRKSSYKVWSAAIPVKKKKGERAASPTSRRPLFRSPHTERNHQTHAERMSKRAKMDNSIVMDEVDGFSAKELFGQGEKNDRCRREQPTRADVSLPTWAPPPPLSVVYCTFDLFGFLFAVRSRSVSVEGAFH